MIKFKSGDKIRRVNGNFFLTKRNGIYTVEKVSAGGIRIHLEGVEGSYDATNFELVSHKKTYFEEELFTL